MSETTTKIRVEVVRACVFQLAADGPSYKMGDELDVDEQLARSLIEQGVVREVSAADVKPRKRGSKV